MNGIATQTQTQTRSRGRAVGEEPAEKRILLCEDDNDMRILLLFALESRGYAVTACNDGVGLLQCLRSPFAAVAESFDLVVTDVRLPRLGGLDALEVAAEAVTLPPFIVITAFGNRETHERARDLGAAAVLDKPFDTADLVSRAWGILGPPFLASEPRD